MQGTLETTPTFHIVARMLYYFIEGGIFVGFLSVILDKNERNKFNVYYLFLSLIVIFLLVFTIFAPLLTNYLGTTRLFHLTLIFLAPFSVIGIMKIFQFILGLFRAESSQNRLLTAICFVYLFSLLFNTGFIYELTNDHPDSIALSSNRLYGSIEEKSSILSINPSFEQDIFTGAWFNEYRIKNINIYSDNIGSRILKSYGNLGLNPRNMISRDINPDGYIYLGVGNTKYQTIIESQLIDSTPKNYVYPLPELSPVLKSSDRIYSSGWSNIYLSR